jgi:hypothetical protein
MSASTIPSAPMPTAKGHPPVGADIHPPNACCSGPFGPRRRIAARSMGAALRPIGATWRSKVRRAYRGPAKWGDEARRALTVAIFEVENELEHRSPLNPQVAAMRAARNVLLDDLGENEPPPRGGRYPAVEAAERLVRERRRSGNVDAFRRATP